MNDVVRHSAVVVSIADNQMRVQIQQESACAGCHLRSMCQSSEHKVKEVVLPDVLPGVEVGDVVVLEGRLQQTRMAVMLAYILPLFLLLVVLSVGVPLWGETTSILLVVITLAAYYVVLYLCRQRISRRFTFRAIQSSLEL